MPVNPIYKKTALMKNNFTRADRQRVPNTAQNISISSGIVAAAEMVVMILSFEA